MKLMSKLANYSHKLALAILAVLPLVMLAPQASAANNNDVEFSQSELDQMLAPIALYPDALLSQVLIASTYPLEIVQADRWVRSNKDLKTEDALKFAENKDWDPSVRSLVAFPDILKRMSEDVDWTQRLGDAFLSSEEDVMDTVQRLRKRAYAAGNLEKAQHIKVEQEDNTIVIEPAEERVVYVPVYDTRVVYGNWWWPDYPPVYWNYPGNYTYVSGFYWGPSIYIGSSYFYSSCRWNDRRVVVVDRRVHYNNEPRFYTGRSIVRFEGARNWQHDPVHRHGVAYYNNNLRNTYGSRHESFQDDRQYRDNHREFSRPDNNNDGRNNPRIIRARDNNPAANTTIEHGPVNRPQVDRAEQLRERMSRTNDANGRQQWQGADNQPRRNLNRDNNQLTPAPTNNGENNVQSPTNQQPDRTISRDRIENDRSVPHTHTFTGPERTNQAGVIRNINTDTNNDANNDRPNRNPGLVRGINTGQADNHSLERAQQEARQNTERFVQQPSSQPVIRTEDNHRTDTRIESPRPEHSNNTGNGRITRNKHDDDKTN